MMCGKRKKTQYVPKWRTKQGFVNVTDMSDDHLRAVLRLRDKHVERARWWETNTA